VLQWSSRFGTFLPGRGPHGLEALMGIVLLRYDDSFQLCGRLSGVGNARLNREGGAGSIRSSDSSQ
jgi:hypothetical protein